MPPSPVGLFDRISTESMLGCVLILSLSMHLVGGAKLANWLGGPPPDVQVHPTRVRVEWAAPAAVKEIVPALVKPIPVNQRPVHARSISTNTSPSEGVSSTGLTELPALPPDGAQSGLSTSVPTDAGGTVSVPSGGSLVGGGESVRPSHGTSTEGRGSGGVDSSRLTVMPVFLQVLSPAEVDRFYPLDAREQELEATVLLRLTIDAEGRVVEAVPLDDPGNGFAEAARQRMLRERFVPGRLNGRPVPTEIQFKVRFQRDD